MKTSIITLLLVCAALFSLAQTINQAEYFIDKDKGVGKNTKLNVTLAADSSFTFLINLTGITPGFHQLYVRTKNSNNKWSFTVRKTIEVLGTAAFADVNKGEYFFDTDPGVGKATAFAVNPADTAVTKTFNAKTTGLQPGYHSLYIRTKDSEGRWSVSTRKSIEIIKSLDTAKITAAEYFFSNDPGFGKATKVTFATPAANGTFNFNIPYNEIPSKADTLFVRVVNSDNRWSLTKLAKFSGAPAIVAIPPGNFLQTGTGKTALPQFKIAVNLNPVKGNMLTIYIQHTGKAGLQLDVYSLDGKRVLSQPFDVAGNTSRQINVGMLSIGSYILHVSDGVTVQSVLFMKE